MSVSGISSSSLYNTQNPQNSFQQIQQTFKQLGQDLQSGNLSAAQSDFATLQQLVPQLSSSSSAQSKSPIDQAFNQLAKDLQSGNLPAAQQDFTTIQQDAQSQSAQTQSTGEHHHHHGGNSAASEASQRLAQLGTALQSGNLSSAQQAFSSLTQLFQQSAASSQAASQTASEPASQSNSTGVSITA